MERTIKIKDAKILKLLHEKGVLIEEAREISKVIEKEVEKRARIGSKVQDMKDKIAPLIASLKVDIAEFEDIVEIDVDGDSIVLKVIDQIEAFKELYRNKKNTEAIKKNVKQPSKKK